MSSDFFQISLQLWLFASVLLWLHFFFFCDCFCTLAFLAFKLLFLGPSLQFAPSLHCSLGVRGAWQSGTQSLRFDSQRGLLWRRSSGPQSARQRRELPQTNAAPSVHHRSAAGRSVQLHPHSWTYFCVWRSRSNLTVGCLWSQVLIVLQRRARLTVWTNTDKLWTLGEKTRSGIMSRFLFACRYSSVVTFVVECNLLFQRVNRRTKQSWWHTHVSVYSRIHTVHMCSLFLPFVPFRSSLRKSKDPRASPGNR